MIKEYIVIWNEEQYPCSEYKEAVEIAKYLVADEIYPSRCKALILETISTNFNEDTKFPSVMLVEWFDDMHKHYFKINQLM